MDGWVSIKEMFMRRQILGLFVAALLVWGSLAAGDVLELKNGTILDGKYAGGTATTLRFETATGMQVIETAQIIALTFTTAAGARPLAPAAPAGAPTAAPAAPPATPAPGSIQSAGTVTLPAGTMLLVRMMDSVSSKSATGAKFAALLQLDLAAGDTVAVKAGTMIHGRVESATQARRAVGKSTLNIALTEIVINGKPVPIVTSNYKEAGADSLRKVAGGAAAGAIIGGVGAGEAGKGAAIGATVGALVKGETVTIPPGAMLEFTLRAPVTLPSVG